MVFSATRAFDLSSSTSLLLCVNGAALSQTAKSPGGTILLLQIQVSAPRALLPRRPKTRVTTGKRRETPATPPPSEAQVVAGKNEKFDKACHNIVAIKNCSRYARVQHCLVQQ